MIIRPFTFSIFFPIKGCSIDAMYKYKLMVKMAYYAIVSQRGPIKWGTGSLNVFQSFSFRGIFKEEPNVNLVFAELIIPSPTHPLPGLLSSH